MTEEKKLKVVFAPGAFDTFEGTQEELDELIADVQKMFEGKTPDELELESNPVDLEELLEEDPELAEQLFKQISELETRKLN